MIASFSDNHALYARVPFVRRDVGIPVPDDGIYYRTLHPAEMGLESGLDYPVPSIVHAAWGIETEAKANGDYHPIIDMWQEWFLSFWDWASGYRLPVGDMYTPGSLVNLYARMIQDAKSHTDAAPPEAGARDIITGRNLDGKPWQWLCRPCTGALLRVEAIAGAILKVKCIDLLGVPPNPATLKIWQFYFGTQLHPDGSITRYPDVKEAFAVHGFDPAGTAMPLVAPGGYFYINKSACKRLIAGETWTPYYP